MHKTAIEAAALAPAIAAHIVRGDDADAFHTADYDVLAVWTAQVIWAATIEHIQPEQRESLTEVVASRLARIAAVTALALPDGDDT